MTDRNRERLRWRSRRGMLEMDILLTRFLDRYLNILNEEELIAYDELLDLPDNDFLKLALGLEKPTEIRWVGLLTMIRDN